MNKASDSDSMPTSKLGLRPGERVNNETLCKLLDVPRNGRIRESRGVDRIVLISDRTRQFPSDQWRGDILEFVGAPNNCIFLRGRPNTRLAKSTEYSITIHLFNKLPLGQYEYVGPVELADHPYHRENLDQPGEPFIEWIFPVRLRLDAPTRIPSIISRKLLPYACSAVIGDNIPQGKRREFFDLLDRLKALGITVVDQRDLEDDRYFRAWSKREYNTIRHMEKETRSRIRLLKKEAKRRNQRWCYEEDELELNGTHERIKAVFELIGYGGEYNQLREEADRAFPYPDLPSYAELISPDEDEAFPSKDMNDLLKPKARKRDFSKINFD